MKETANRAEGALRRVPCATCGHERLLSRLRRYLVYVLIMVAFFLALPAFMVWCMAARLLLGKPFMAMPVNTAWAAFWEALE